MFAVAIATLIVESLALIISIVNLIITIKRK